MGASPRASGRVTLHQVGDTDTFQSDAVGPFASEGYVIWDIWAWDNDETPARSHLGFTTQIVSAGSPPVANAGPDQTVKEGDVVQLTGAGSDPDGDALTFSWTQVSGPQVVLSTPNSMNASFVAPHVDGSEVLVFRLTVSDGTFSVHDDVSITVEDDDVTGPTLSAAAPSVATTGQPIVLQVQATDPKGVDRVYADWWTETTTFFGKDQGRVVLQPVEGSENLYRAAAIGPFDAPLKIHWRITATDADDTPAESEMSFQTDVIAFATKMFVRQFQIKPPLVQGDLSTVHVDPDRNREWCCPRDSSGVRRFL